MHVMRDEVRMMFRTRRLQVFSELRNLAIGIEVDPDAIIKSYVSEVGFR